MSGARSIGSGGEVPADPREALDAHLRRPRLDELRGGVLRAADDLRVRAIDDELHVRGRAAGEVGRVTRRNDERRPRPSRPQRALDLVVAAHLPDEIVEAGRLHPAREVARRRAPVLVVDERAECAGRRC